MPDAPKLARRAANRHSTLKSGRVIGEKREKLETASERAAARNKIKRSERRRVLFTAVGFVIVAIVLVLIVRFFTQNGEEIIESTTVATVVNPYAPTIAVVDEDTGKGAASLTTRMKEYIGQAEADFRELGYTPVQAVIPAGAIREVDFYLDGVPGYIKLIADRGAGVSVEDADRMLRYLAEQGVDTFEYIDVRIDGKAYWR